MRDRRRIGRESRLKGHPRSRSPYHQKKDGSPSGSGERKRSRAMQARRAHLHGVNNANVNLPSIQKEKDLDRIDNVSTRLIPVSQVEITGRNHRLSTLWLPTMSLAQKVPISTFGLLVTRTPLQDALRIEFGEVTSMPLGQASPTTRAWLRLSVGPIRNGGRLVLVPNRVATEPARWRHSRCI